jgi:cytochrome c-type biogenesis protein CcmH
MGFWVSAGAMVAMVALVLLQALRHGRAQALATPGAEDLGVYRDQLAEVERDLARGTLPQAEAERLRLEVQRRMLEADRTLRKAASPAMGLSFPLGSASVLAALAAAVAGYFWLGVPGYRDLPLSDRIAAADALYQGRPSQLEAEAAASAFTIPESADPEFLDLMAKLRSAMASRPDDLQGQTLLAQNEASLGNFPGARQAQEAVVRLKGDAATGEDLANLAEAMIYAAGGIVTPEAEAVLIRCLTLDPRNGSARFYSGLMFAQIGRPDRAFSLWQPLLAEGPANAPWIQPIRDRIEAAAAEAGINYALPAEARGPDAADIAAAAEMSAEDRQDMIRGMVDGLEQRLTAEGGPAEDWARLIAALGVLAETTRARTAYARAQAAFEGRPGELATLRAAAVQAGIAE